MNRPVVSVVIPTLDEEPCLAGAISSVHGEPGLEPEVIVVDGGSRDATRALAAASGASVLVTSACRGLQLDTGARAAAGEWLLFLHADTHLERGWSGALLGLAEDVAGGAFRFVVDSPRRGFRVIESAVALRCRMLKLPFGDQAIFARRSAYAAAGGFPHLPLMEDVAFIGRLRRVGRLAFPRPRALTSPRRWERYGLAGTTLRNWTLVALYAGGCPPARLARVYGPGIPPPCDES